MLVSIEGQHFTDSPQKWTVKGNFNKVGLYCIPEKICALCLGWDNYFNLYRKTTNALGENPFHTSVSAAAAFLFFFGVLSRAQLLTANWKQSTMNTDLGKFGDSSHDLLPGVLCVCFWSFMSQANGFSHCVVTQVHDQGNDGWDRTCFPASPSCSPHHGET